MPAINQTIEKNDVSDTAGIKNHHVHYSYQVPPSSGIVWNLDKDAELLAMVALCLILMVVVSLIAVVYYALKYRADALSGKIIEKENKDA